MSDYTADGVNRPQHMQAFGNIAGVTDKVSVPSTFTTTDKARVLRVPAGLEIWRVVLDNTDLDTGATLVHKVGYEAVKTGSSLVANDSYFGSGLTHLRSVGRNEMAGFEPIVFNEDVYITVIPTAGPATTAGTIRGFAYGDMRGIK